MGLEESKMPLLRDAVIQLNPSDTSTTEPIRMASPENNEQATLTLHDVSPSITTLPDDPSAIALNGPTNGASITSGILLLMNTSIGSGLVATPFAFACLGTIYGFFWISISAIFVAFSFHALIQVARYLVSVEGQQGKPNTSIAEAVRVIAPPLFPLVNISIILSNWGVCISYLVLIGNTMPMLIASVLPDLQVPREAAIFITLFTLIFPLCLVKKLTSLKFASILALICIGYVMSLIVAYFFLFLWYADYSFPNGLVILGAGEDGFNTFTYFFERTIDYWRAGSIQDLMRALPIFVFGFTCHGNACKLYNELAPQTRTPLALRKLIVLAFFSIYCIYLIIGLLGYITLGNGVTGDILSSYDIPGTFFSLILDRVDPHRISLLLGRLSIAILVMTCFPVQLHPARDAIFQSFEDFKIYLIERRSRHDNGQTRFEPIAEDETTDHELDMIVGHFDDKSALLSTSIDLERQNLLDIPSTNTSIKIIKDAADYPYKAFFLLTLAFCLFSFLIACLVTDFSRVLAFVGATGSNWIALFFGPFCYYRILAHWSLSKFASLFLVLFSIALMVSVISFEIYNLTS